MVTWMFLSTEEEDDDDVAAADDCASLRASASAALSSVTVGSSRVGIDCPCCRVEYRRLTCGNDADTGFSAAAEIPLPVGLLAGTVGKSVEGGGKREEHAARAALKVAWRR